MLPEFKKRIDTLRDILVGAVPSPAGQIEQITYALIYKFMSDIDDSATSLPGGKRTYFTDEYEKYSWHELMTPSLGAHERLTLYREALGSLAKNPGLPDLFQGIFQNAYLTFNDPRVLTLFLKEIDNFKHSSSDDIGDAYEYLLQITGAQGDVGQFRTPRHIIKFIVEAVNPTKNDSVLDPAVGTAGFLIAAYNHVKHHHDGVNDISGLPDEKEQQLTSDEREKLYKNYHGFDIDPTMVRTAKVNMYLHGFKTPDIKNHDSLTSVDYWNERYDVILANPPFMSPKGGIKPHDKFGIVANRSEVLFIDYIASHLKPNGRAGIVVPEGIIFQSGKAYKELRKNLVDNYLYAVISLPTGVFQPYSGVKTSVLLLDKELAKHRDKILFVKIENDGYSLGTQRRETTGSQFPEALTLIKKYISDEEIVSEFAHTIAKDRIGESDDYNLSGDRYKSTAPNLNREWPLVRIDEVFLEVKNGKNVTQIDKKGKYRVSRIQTIATGKVNLEATKWTNDEVKNSDFLQNGDILFSHINSYDHLAKTALFTEQETVVHGSNLLRMRTDTTKALPLYLSFILKSDHFKNDAKRFAQKAVNQASINSSTVKNLEIPLPPIDVQHKIASELDNYQKIIDAAHTIVKSYKPTIKINSDWGRVKISDLFNKVTDSWTPTSKNASEYNFYIGLENIESRTGRIKISSNQNQVVPTSNKIWFKNGDILYGKLRPNLNKVAYANLGDSICSTDILVLRPKITNTFTAKVYTYLMREEEFNQRVMAGISGSQLPRVKPSYFLDLTVPNIPKADQKKLLEHLEEEHSLINANKKLIALYEQKIKLKIAEVWGD
jgi:type I restriction enzyme M protein